MNGMYEELIEKLRKNNRMSGWTHIDRLMDEAAEAIEALQAENERLNAALDKAADMIGESRCPTEKILKTYKCSDFENCLHCWKDWLLGGKEDVTSMGD